MSRPRAFPIATRVPAPVFDELEAAAAARLTTISTIVRDFLTAAHLSGAFAAHLAAQLTAPNPTPNPMGLAPAPVAPSAAPAAPPTTAPVRNLPAASDELSKKLDALFGVDDEPAAPAPAHTASTPTTHAPQPDAEEDHGWVPEGAVYLDSPPDDVLTPEEQAKEAARAAKRAEYERFRATVLTPEQVQARIAEGMAAVRSQPGHGYVEPWVPVTHAPHREPLTATNSSQLPEPGTPEWVAMAERQGLPADAIAEVVASTQPAEAAPAAKPVPTTFDFDAWGD